MLASQNSKNAQNAETKTAGGRRKEGREAVFLVKKPPEAAGKGGGAAFLGARRLQVWRSRLTEESARGPHTGPRAPWRGGPLGPPPLYQLLSLVCVARVCFPL